MTTMRTLQELLNEGSMLLQAQRIDEAQVLAASLVTRFPEHAEVRLFASDVSSLRGDAVDALAHLDALPESVAAHPRIFIRKAELLIGDGRRKQALEVARNGLPLDSVNEQLLCRLARIFLDLLQLSDARDCLVAGLARLPGNLSVLYLLAVAECQLQHPEEAMGYLDAVLQKESRHSGALHLRSRLRPAMPELNHIAELRSILDASGAPADTDAATSNAERQTRALTHYAIALESEEIGDYQESAAAYLAGAREYRTMLSYSAAVELGAQADIRERVLAARLAQLDLSTSTAKPVFLVGLPGAGEPRVTRLLTRHSALAPIGEYGDFKRLMSTLVSKAAPEETSDAEACLAIDFDELGRRYLETRREAMADGQEILDSTLYQFLYMGFITAAVPGARFIHLCRDPVDHCYGLFTTLFFGAHSYSYDLDELVDYYLSYHQHMEHWKALFPDQILDVTYEDLLQDMPGQAARILEHCSLEWEDAVLDSDGPNGPEVREVEVGAWSRGGAAFETVAARLRKELAQGR
ncbi:putative sulfotransferase [gamma proteobacterium NOR5-3]|nr:putative sulfotransferase [gamma proteobacterium NOR5-3]